MTAFARAVTGAAASAAGSTRLPAGLTLVLVAVLISIFPILISVTEGARSIPRQHLDVAAIFGSNERQLWRDVIVPYVMPFAMSGIKQSIALSMAGTLVAEFKRVVLVPRREPGGALPGPDGSVSGD